MHSRVCGSVLLVHSLYGVDADVILDGAGVVQRLQDGTASLVTAISPGHDTDSYVGELPSAESIAWVRANLHHQHASTA